MINKVSRNDIRLKKHARMRNRIFGTTARPRLCVFRSNNHMYAQIIDDTKGHTLCAASTLEQDAKELEQTDNVEAASFVGKSIAKKAIDKGIKEVVFDRSGYIYHGKVKALAEAARKVGLEF